MVLRKNAGGRLAQGGGLLVVCVALVADWLIGSILGHIPAVELPFEYTVLLGPMVILWYIIGELGSLAEHAVDIRSTGPLLAAEHPGDRKKTPWTPPETRSQRAPARAATKRADFPHHQPALPENLKGAKRYETIEEILLDYTRGEKDLPETNEALKETGSGLILNPSRNEITEEEKRATTVGYYPDQANGWGAHGPRRGRHGEGPRGGRPDAGREHGEEIAFVYIAGRKYRLLGDILADPEV